MIDIIIVNWNSGNYLCKCIKSIFVNSNADIVNKVIIVDNNSSDTSLTDILQHNKIEIIRNTENAGFAKACNQGYKKCISPYILFLNPDTQLFENTLANCLTYMETHKEVDVLGCQLIDDDGNIAPSCARFPTPATIFNDATGLSKIAPKIFKPATLMSDWSYTESRFVDQIIGAFMFMPKTVFEKVGLFDERFFVYFEELDFSFRLSNLGGKSFYNTEIKAKHSEGGTTSKVKALRLFLFLQSRLLYAKKHYSFIGYCFVFFTTFFIELITRFIFLLINGKFGEVKDLFAGYKMLFKKFFFKK